MNSYTERTTRQGQLSQEQSRTLTHDAIIPEHSALNGSMRSGFARRELLSHHTTLQTLQSRGSCRAPDEVLSGSCRWDDIHAASINLHTAKSTWRGTSLINKHRSRHMYLANTTPHSAARRVYGTRPSVSECLATPNTRCVTSARGRTFGAHARLTQIAYNA